MSALREVTHILRGIAVWFAWFLLPGKPFHDRSYGELRRLTPKQLSLHLLPMTIVVAVAAHIYLNTPPGFGYFWGAMTVVGAATGGTLVVGTFVLSRVIDWRLTHA